jgi:hypothetical protein
LLVAPSRIGRVRNRNDEQFNESRPAFQVFKKRILMSSINFKRTYVLREEYERIKERAIQILDKYLGYPDLLTFNDVGRSVTFSTERLIPTASTNRPRVLLLFSNPHPLSIYQGMFLSPNSRGQESLFSSAMRDAGWLTIAESIAKLGQSHKLAADSLGWANCVWDSCRRLSE